MVRNKNLESLENEKKAHKHRFSLNLARQPTVEKNTRKGAYTPELFKDKESIEKSKQKTNRSQAKS